MNIFEKTCAQNWKIRKLQLTVDCDKMRFGIGDFGPILGLYKGHLSGNLLWIRAARRRCTRIRRQNGGHCDWSIIVGFRLVNGYDIDNWDAIGCGARLKYVFFLYVCEWFHLLMTHQIFRDAQQNIDEIEAGPYLLHGLHNMNGSTAAVRCIRIAGRCDGHNIAIAGRCRRRHLTRRRGLIGRFNCNEITLQCQLGSHCDVSVCNTKCRNSSINK